MLKFCIRTPISRTKSQPIPRHHQRSSRRIQLWPWSRKHSPHICSLGTAKTLKRNHKKKICLHGGNHFSKRRSENRSYNRQSESYNRYQRNNSKNDIQSENDDTEVESKEKLKTTLKNCRSKNNSKGRRSESHREDPRRIQGRKR